MFKLFCVEEGEKRDRTIQSLKQEIQSNKEKQKTLSIEIANFKRKNCELQTVTIHHKTLKLMII